MPKPETETVELRTDTIRELIDLLRDPGAFNSYKPPMKSARRKAVAARFERNLEG